MGGRPSFSRRELLAAICTLLLLALLGSWGVWSRAHGTSRAGEAKPPATVAPTAAGTCEGVNPLVPVAGLEQVTTEEAAGFGSTWQAWAKARPGGMQYACREGPFAEDYAGVYWFPPRMRTPFGRFKYNLVTGPEGRVILLWVGFPNGDPVLAVQHRGGPTTTVTPAERTTYAQAVDEVTALLPPDARLGRELLLPAEEDAGCLLRPVRSRTLDRLLGGDQQVLVRFDGDVESAFDPTQVPAAAIAAVPQGRMPVSCFLAPVR
jgi:hypothetical protein